MKDRLEPEYAEAFRAYKAAPTPATAGAMLRAVRPVLALGVKTYGGGDSPILMGKARRIALDALPKYDPQVSSIKTHLMAHLRGLQRSAMRLDEPLDVPEQVVLDRRRLHAATADLRERLSRDPSDAELADHTSLSLKRIAHVRRYRPAMAEGEVATLFGGGDGADGEEGPFEPAVVGADPTRLHAEWLYPDLAGPDQLLLEHRLGLNGAPILPMNEIARKMNVSPAAVSQRAARLQARLDELADYGVLR